MPDIFCVKCKDRTETKGLHDVAYTDAHGRHRMKEVGKCAECGTNKTRFMKSSGGRTQLPGGRTRLPGGRTQLPGRGVFQDILHNKVKPAVMKDDWWLSDPRYKAAQMCGMKPPIGIQGYGPKNPMPDDVKRWLDCTAGMNLKGGRVRKAKSRYNY